MSLASASAERGLRVLVVDLDPQGSATEWLGGHESPVGLVEYSEGGIPLADLVFKSTTAPGVALIPTSPSLVPPGGAGRNETRSCRRPRPRAVACLLGPRVEGCSTRRRRFGYLSLASLVAADGVVIPFEGHALGLSGVGSVIEWIDLARQHVNRHLELVGILACRVTATSHTRGVIAKLREQFGTLVFEHTRARRCPARGSAPAFHLPINLYAPKSRVAASGQQPIEILDRLGDLTTR